MCLGANKRKLKLGQQKKVIRDNHRLKTTIKLTDPKKNKRELSISRILLKIIFKTIFLVRFLREEGKLKTYLLCLLTWFGINFLLDHIFLMDKAFII